MSRKVYVAHSPNLKSVVARWAEEEGSSLGELHFPIRDAEDELVACRTNCDTMKKCDEVVVFWDEHSHSTIVDIGMALALEKPIRATFRPDHSLRLLLDRLTVGEGGE